jgi:hypothetical protein
LLIDVGESSGVCDKFNVKLLVLDRLDLCSAESCGSFPLGEMERIDIGGERESLAISSVAGWIVSDMFADDDFIDKIGEELFNEGLLIPLWFLAKGYIYHLQY